MEIKTRKLHNKKIIIDANPIEEKQEPKNNNISNNSTNQISIPVVILLVVVLSLVSGCLGAYLMLTSLPNTTTTSNGITTSTTKLSETNSISTAVTKVYDAVVVVEVYKEKKLVSSGTGFAFARL